MCAIAFSAWLSACTFGPGSISKSNLEDYRKAYPFDGHLWTEGKVIQELGVMRPARSKYDPVGGVLIPKFDHYCPWVNNCVGERNMRWFLAFLLLNTLLCCYATVLLGYLLYNELRLHRVYDLYFMSSRGKPTRLGSSPAKLLQWILLNYSEMCILLLLVAIVAALLGSFFVYQIGLVARNLTTYETHKLELIQEGMLRRVLREARSIASEPMDAKRVEQAFNSDDEEDDDQDDDIEELLGDSACCDCVSVYRRWSVRRRSWSTVKQLLPAHLYDRGLAANVREAMVPSLAELQSYWKHKKLE